MSQKSGGTSKKSRGKRNQLAEASLSTAPSTTLPGRRSVDSLGHSARHSGALVLVKDTQGHHPPRMEARGDPPSYPADESTVYDPDDRYSMTTTEGSEVEESEKPGTYHHFFKESRTTTHETGFTVNGNVVDSDTVMAKLTGKYLAPADVNGGILVNGNTISSLFPRLRELQLQHHKKV